MAKEQMHAFKILNAIEISETLPERVVEKLRNHEFEKWEVDKIKVWFNATGLIRACNVAAEIHLGCTFVENKHYHIAQFIPALKDISYIQQNDLSPKLKRLKDEEQPEVVFWGVEGKPKSGKFFFMIDDFKQDLMVKLTIIPNR
jgi:hypothetical protein